MKIETLPSEPQCEEIVMTYASEREAWDEFVSSHPLGTPFHLVSWQRVIQSTFGHQPRHIIAKDSANGRVVGVLPLFLVRSLIFGRILTSTPQAAYGGILASSQNVARTILRAALQIAQKSGVQFLELRSFSNAVGDDGLLRKDLYVTFRKELNPDHDANLL